MVYRNAATYAPSKAQLVADQNAIAINAEIASNQKKLIELCKTLGQQTVMQKAIAAGVDVSQVQNRNLDKVTINNTLIAIIDACK